MGEPYKRRFNKKELLGMLMANSIMVGIIISVPLLVGRVIDIFQKSEGYSGIIVSVELGAIALASIVLSAFIMTINVRKIVRIGIVIFFLSNLMSWWAAEIVNLPLFITMRLASGLSGGVMISAVWVLAAGALNPQKIYSLISFFEMLAGLICISTIAFLTELVGPAISFGGLAGIAFITLPFVILFFPQYTAPTQKDGNHSGLTLTKIIVMLIIGSFFVGLGSSLLMPYYEVIGRNLNIPLPKISAVLFLGQILGLGTAVLSGLIGDRVGKIIQAFVLATVLVSFPLLIVFSKSFGVYAAGGLIVGMTSGYLFPFIGALYSVFDNTGRLIAIFVGIVTICASLGPFIGGLVIEIKHGFFTLGWISTFILLVWSMIMIFSSFHADRKRNTL